MNVTDILEMISLSTWFIDVGITVLLYIIWNRTNEASSSLITMVVVVIANSLVIGHETVLNVIQGPEPDFNPYIVFSWYFGKILLFTLTMLSIRKVHKDKMIKIGTLGKYVNNALYGLGTLQVLMYGEIALFKSEDTIGNIYSFGMPAIGISTTTIGLYLLFYSYYHLCLKNTARESLKWNI
jgi:hypothetical protein